MLELCPNPKGLFYDSPIGAAKDSKQLPYLSLIPPVPLGLLDHTFQVVEKPEKQLGPTEEPSSVPVPTQS